MPRLDPALLPADPRQRRVVAAGPDTESDSEPDAESDRLRVALQRAVGQSRAERFRQPGAVLELSRSPVEPIRG